MAASPHIDRVTPVILAGGLGLRLRSVLPHLPKGLAPIGGRPLLAYLLDRLEREGYPRAVLCLGYKAQAIADALGDRHGALTLVHSREDAPLGTAGALRLALSAVDTPWLLAANGDTLLDLSPTDYLDWHFSRPRRISLVGARVPDVSRFGRLRLGPDGQVLAFEEKGGASGPGVINAGLYLIPRDILADLPEGRFSNLESDVFPGLAGQGLEALVTDAAFLDVGVPGDYAQARADFGELDLQAR